MGRDIAIQSRHGPVSAWRADPANGEAPRGAVVLLQEIFGVNPHIRSVADGYAASGLVVVAPALFDPVETHMELGYDETGFARGRELAAALGFDRATDIVADTAMQLREEGHALAVVGFCWGGSVAFLANTRLGLPAVSYYGARTMPFIDEPLRAPMLFHFGERDPIISASDIEAHRRHHPDAVVHVYADAGHGFNRDVDPRHFHAASASLARRRTMDFLKKILQRGMPR